MDLGERPRYVGDVLEHLDAERGVERAVGHRQRRRVRLDELDVRRALVAARRQGEHGLAAVDADDPAVGADLLEQLRHVEARAAADVEHAVAGLGADGRAHERPAAQHVARRVGGLDRLRDLVVELELRHLGERRLAVGGRHLDRDPVEHRVAGGDVDVHRRRAGSS